MKFIITITLLCFAFNAFADDIIKPPEKFIAESFDNNPPEKKTFEVGKDLKKPINKIMQGRYNIRKLDYWLKDGRSVWVLEAIGKYKPITTGFIVSDDKLEEIEVLVYRESHGWEVKYPFFTDQFKEVALDGKRLDKYIDGISGATLSVNALKRKAALALFLHKQVIEDGKVNLDRRR